MHTALLYKICNEIFYFVEKLKENAVVNKRPLSQSEPEGAAAKKIRLDEKTEKGNFFELFFIIVINN